MVVKIHIVTNIKIIVTTITKISYMALDAQMVPVLI